MASGKVGSATPRRRVLMVPFGGGAVAVLCASTAWACGALIGQIDLTGNAAGVAVTQASGGKHGAPVTNGVTATSCVVNAGQSPRCQPDPALGGGDVHPWVTVKTSSYLGTVLPASSGTYSPLNCPSTNPVSTLRCTAANSGASVPPVGIQNDVGDYWVNLVQSQWANTDAAAGTAGSTRFDGNERVSGALSSGCANGADQTARVIHLGLATIGGSGQITGVSSPVIEVARAYVDDPTVPPPGPGAGTGEWKFYLPTTNLTPESPAGPPVVANSVCVVDRYGTRSIEAPLQFVAL